MESMRRPGVRGSRLCTSYRRYRSAAAGVVDGQGRVGEVEDGRRSLRREAFDGQARRMIDVGLHGVRRRMNNGDAAFAGGLEDGVHAQGKFIDAFGGAAAPVLVPHVADDDGGLFGVEGMVEADLLVLTAAAEGFGAGAQVQVDGGGVSGEQQQQEESHG